MVIFLIERYEIVKDGNEEILIIYLNYKYEFSKDFMNFENDNNLKEKIKKIKFNGSKVIIMVGTLVLGTLFINASFSPIINNNEISNKNIVKEETSISIENKDLEDNVKEEINNKQDTTNSKKDEDTNDKINFKQNIISDIDNKVNEEENDKTEEKQVKETIENAITLYRSNGEILNLTINEYLIGAVAGEMPASFNIEALKAQAVVSRTYLLKRIKNNNIIIDSTMQQVYKDNNELKNMWKNDFDKYYSKIKKAVLDTDKIAIYYNGDYIDALYHSTSNGYTLNSENVWSNAIPYLKGVESKWDLNASSYLKNTNKDIAYVLSLFGIDDINKIQIVSRDDTNHVKEIKVGYKIYKGTAFRSLLKLRSTDFDIMVNDNSVVFITRGFGHGVGMSQYGANGMANEGYNYIDILNHYYTNVSIY